MQYHILKYLRRERALCKTAACISIVVVVIVVVVVVVVEGGNEVRLGKTDPFLFSKI